MTAATVSLAAPHEGFATSGELRECMRLVVPLAAAQLATVGMGLTDTLMMGRLGKDALAGGALGVSCYSTLLVVCGGLVAPLAPLIADARGRGDDREAISAARGGCLAAAAVGLVGTLLLMGAGPLLQRLGQDPTAITEATAYLHLVAPGFLPALVLVALRHAVTAHARPHVVLAVTAAGAVLNALADVVLMRGALGMPGLGLAGIGAASAVVNWAMLAVLAAYASRSGFFGHGRRWRLSSGAATLLRSLVRLGLPVAVMFGLEVGLFTLTTINVGRHGSIWLAGHQIALQTTYVTYIVPHGISQAAAVRVGHWHGAGDRAAARRAGLVAMGLAAAFMLLMSATFWGAPEAIVGMYVSVDDPDSGQVIAAGTSLLMIAAAFQVFDGVQVTAAGALRGLQDTRVPALITTVAYVLFGAPLSVLGGQFIGAAGCWAALAVGLAVSGIGLAWRFLHVAQSAPARPIHAAV